jgi:hypothetical protein
MITRPRSLDSGLAGPSLCMAQVSGGVVTVTCTSERPHIPLISSVSRGQGDYCRKHSQGGEQKEHQTVAAGDRGQGAARPGRGGCREQRGTR